MDDGSDDDSDDGSDDGSDDDLGDDCEPGKGKKLETILFVSSLINFLTGFTCLYCKNF